MVSRPRSPAHFKIIASSTLLYSSFEIDDPSPSATNFSLGSDSYKGKVFTVELRLHASKTTNGNTCSADSSAVTVKKVIAVDP